MQANSSCGACCNQYRQTTTTFPITMKMISALNAAGLFCSRRSLPGLLAALLTPAAFANAQTPVSFSSSNKPVSLLELFTSEGCSSCPPAETWLSRLKDSPELWKDFVPVAFHVDYWDRLGWRDSWASKRFSERQRDYAQAWNSDTVYTPEFVLSGREWKGWAGHNGVPSAGGKAGVLVIGSTNGEQWQVSFTPSSPGGQYELHAALLACGLTPNVKAGENRGRRLEHDFVVVSFAEKLMRRQGDAFRGYCNLKPEASVEGGRLALAVWVTEAGKPTSLQATGGWLTESKR